MSTDNSRPRIPMPNELPNGIVIDATEILRKSNDKADKERAKATQVFLSRLPSILRFYLENWSRKYPSSDKLTDHLRKKIVFMAKRQAQHCADITMVRRAAPTCVLSSEVTLQYWGFKLVLKPDGTYYTEDTK